MGVLMIFRHISGELPDQESLLGVCVCVCVCVCACVHTYHASLTIQRAVHFAAEVVQEWQRTRAFAVRCVMQLDETMDAMAPALTHVNVPPRVLSDPWNSLSFANRVRISLVGIPDIER